jgi:predicted transcriptional regulator
MAESRIMTVLISPEISDKREALARDTRSPTENLAGGAIAAFVEANIWQVARIKASLEDAKTGSPGVPHAEMAQWVASWNSDEELPRPEAKP